MGNLRPGRVEMPRRSPRGWFTVPPPLPGTGFLRLPVSMSHHTVRGSRTPLKEGTRPLFLMLSPLDPSDKLSGSEFRIPDLADAVSWDPAVTCSRSWRPPLCSPSGVKPGPSAAGPRGHQGHVSSAPTAFSPLTRLHRTQHPRRVLKIHCLLPCPNLC